MNNKSRSSVEMNDLNSRPKLKDNDANIDLYDTILVGFPIWWYKAPTIINTFLESYDFSNKKKIIYATSGGSGFGDTIKYLEKSVKNSIIIEGIVFKNSINGIDDFIKKL